MSCFCSAGRCTIHILISEGGDGGKYRHSATAAEREELRCSDGPVSLCGFSQTGASVQRDKKISVKTRDTLAFWFQPRVPGTWFVTVNAQSQCDGNFVLKTEMWTEVLHRNVQCSCLTWPVTCDLILGHFITYVWYWVTTGAYHFLLCEVSI